MMAARTESTDENKMGIAASAQRAFAAMPPHVVDIGLIVRAALGPTVPYHIAATRLPRPPREGKLIEATHSLDSLRVAATELAVLQGTDSAIALAWMLSACGLNGTTPTKRPRSKLTTAVLLQMAAVFSSQGTQTSEHERSTTAATVCVHYLVIAEERDPAGSGVACAVTGFAGFRDRHTGLCATDFELIAEFSAHPNLWKLHDNAVPATASTQARSDTQDAATNRAFAKLRATIDIAAPFNAVTVDAAATLAADNPNTHTAAEALHIADLIVGPSTAHHAAVR